MAVVRAAERLLDQHGRTRIQRQTDINAFNALMRLLAEDELERSQREGDM